MRVLYSAYALSFDSRASEFLLYTVLYLFTALDIIFKTHTARHACRLLVQLETEFSQCQVSDVLLGPAIQAGCEALKAAGCAGKIFVLHASLPSLDCPGRLRNREDRKLLGTDKEKVRAPHALLVHYIHVHT